MAKEKQKKPSKRALARLYAVQGIYLLEMNGEATPDKIRNELIHLSIGAIDGFPSPAEADQGMLDDIINGVFERGAELKENLEKVLTKKWSYNRLERLMQIILKAGAYELIARPDIPGPVIINEYIDITHAFYEGDEPGFVNGILDELAKTVRDG